MSELSEQIAHLAEKLDEKHNGNIERLVRIEANQKHFDECLDDLKKKLFGNGQKGVLQLMEARISKLEKWFWRATGAAFTLGNLIVLWFQLTRR
jgi:hypothetical protein